jgi:hypothetical protein
VNPLILHLAQALAAVSNLVEGRKHLGCELCLNRSERRRVLELVAIGKELRLAQEAANAHAGSPAVVSGQTNLKKKWLY